MDEYAHEVVSPELVLVAPELAAITWRTEALAERPQHTSLPPRRPPVPSRTLERRAFPSAAIVACGLGVFACGIATVFLWLRPEATSARARDTGTLLGGSAVLRRSGSPVARAVVRADAQVAPRDAAPGRQTEPRRQVPDVTSLSVSVAPAGVQLQWTPALPGQSFLVIRRSGAGKPTVVYSGAASEFLDRRGLVSGRLYKYRIYALKRGMRRSPGVPALVRR